MAKPQRRRGRRGRRGVKKELSFAKALDRFESIKDRERGLSGSVQNAYVRCVWVYSAVNHIANAVSGTPFAIFEGDPENLVTGTPLNRIEERPNSHAFQDSSSKFRNAYFTYLLTGGAVFRAFPEMDGHRPISQYAFPRSKFTPQVARDKTTGLETVVQWRTNLGPTYIPGDDIHQDALVNPYHDYEGLSPIQAAVAGISNSIDVSDFTGRFFANDASTGVVFSTDDPRFGPDQATEATAAWKRLNSGVDAAFNPKFVGHGLIPHTIVEPFDARSMRIIALLTKEEIISGIYRIPMDIIGSSEKTGGGVVIGGKTMEPAREMFIINVIMPWAAWYDSEFNRDVAWRFGARLGGRHDFSANVILENRRLERAKTAATLIDRGAPLNEVIKWLDLKLTQQPHGDDFWIEDWRLPARFVLAHGEEVFKREMAPVANAGKAEHIAKIVAQAMQVEAKETARQVERESVGELRPSNQARIAEIMKHDSLVTGDNGRSAF